MGSHAIQLRAVVCVITTWIRLKHRVTLIGTFTYLLVVSSQFLCRLWLELVRCEREEMYLVGDQL